MSELMSWDSASNELLFSSRMIAEQTDKDHSSIIVRDIKNMLFDLGFTEHDFHPAKMQDFENKGFLFKYKYYNGRTVIDEILLNKQLTMCLITGYSVIHRMRVIKRVDELENAVRQNTVPNYCNTQISNVLAFAETAGRMLNMSNSGKLGMLQKIEKEYNIPPILPHYAIDAPVDAVDGSSRVTKSLTALLEENNVGMTAREVYPILERKGIVDRKYRKARCGEKRFWNVTVYGLRYGKNITNPSNQRETQPHFYESKFKELLNIIFSE